mmetsp:Transcript_45417/g.89310  ORF Transcript_45417/g.89310 Transcript_45417/m.89310 type:complete len:81 (+) Transcript_45417:88-330(+)
MAESPKVVLKTETEMWYKRHVCVCVCVLVALSGFVGFVGFVGLLVFLCFVCVCVCVCMRVCAQARYNDGYRQVEGAPDKI